MLNLISVTTAAEVLKSVDRILVIGCSGGGKTTLATRLAEAYSFEYQSLDRDVRWLPNWTVRAKEEQRQILRALVSRDRWVMDGSNPSTFDIRLPRADLILWVRVPRYRALIGLAKRVAANYGTVRFAMAEGCKEPLPDREFLSYIWNFEKESVPRIEQEIKARRPAIPVVMLRSHAEMEELSGG